MLLILDNFVFTKLNKMRLIRLNCISTKIFGFLCAIGFVGILLSVRRLSFTTSNTPCLEQMHLVYVRIPKTGSSTLTRLLWRFGLERNLTFLLPNLKTKRTTGLLEVGKFFLPEKGKFCDLMSNIIGFNYENYRPYFHPDVHFITLLRDPLHHLASTIYYFDFTQRKIPGEKNKLGKTNKLDVFLENPKRYEVGFRRSLTHNPASELLGLSKRDMNDEKKVAEFISNIEKRFSFVLILELFDESVLLLRKLLCWPMKNILYKVHNKNEEIKEIQYTPVQEETLRKWSTVEYKLYDNFKNKLLREIKAAGSYFQEELANFRLILSKTAAFCESSKMEPRPAQLVFPETSFYKEFVISDEFCVSRNRTGTEVFDAIFTQHKKHNFCNGNG